MNQPNRVCENCGESLMPIPYKNSWKHKIGWEIDGIKYCKLCGDAVRYGKAIQSHK